MAQKSSIASVVIAGVLILLGVGIAVAALGSSNEKRGASTTASEESSSSQKQSGSTSGTVEGTTVIRFTDSGFDRASYTSKAGESVTVKNESSMDLEFSSDDHPTHREHAELNMKTLAPGESGTVTPATTGVFKFHDHIHDEYTGTLTVQ
jgi:plastocyanin